MEVFRLARKPFSATLSGMGAAINGARWNSRGTELIYTAANRSLAMAEVAAHLTLATLPPDFVMITIEIPDDIAVAAITMKDLPANWNAFPHPASTRSIGDRFVAENKNAVLKIPSVVTRGDFNYLVNPKHPDFNRIRIMSTETFPFDHRLFKA